MDLANPLSAHSPFPPTPASTLSKNNPRKHQPQPAGSSDNQALRSSFAQTLISETRALANRTCSPSSSARAWPPSSRLRSRRPACRRSAWPSAEPRLLGDPLHLSLQLVSVGVGQSHLARVDRGARPRHGGQPRPLVKGDHLIKQGRALPPGGPPPPGPHRVQPRSRRMLDTPRHCIPLVGRPIIRARGLLESARPAVLDPRIDPLCASSASR